MAVDAMSDALEVALLNAVLRNTAYTSPVTVYLALFTTACTDSALGTEVTGGSYARQAITFAAPTSGTGITSNSASLTFTNMPACTVVDGAIMSTLGGGVADMLFHAPPNSPIAVTAALNLFIPIGDVTVSLA